MQKAASNTCQTRTQISGSHSPAYRVPLAFMCFVMFVGVTACKKSGSSADTNPPTMISADPGQNILPIIAKAKAEAEKQSILLMVYVGAPWCPPCVDFQKELNAGTLDSALPNLRFLKFDADADADRIQAAGYGSEYVPYIVVPNTDGSPSKERIEGAVVAGAKGADVVVRKIHQLLAKDPS